MRSKKKSLTDSLLKWLGQAGQMRGLPHVKEIIDVESH